MRVECVWCVAWEQVCAAADVAHDAGTREEIPDELFLHFFPNKNQSRHSTLYLYYNIKCGSIHFLRGAKRLGVPTASVVRGFAERRLSTYVESRLNTICLIVVCSSFSRQSACCDAEDAFFERSESRRTMKKSPLFRLHKKSYPYS